VYSLTLHKVANGFHTGCLKAGNGSNAINNQTFDSILRSVPVGCRIRSIIHRNTKKPASVTFLTK